MPGGIAKGGGRAYGPNPILIVKGRSIMTPQQFVEKWSSAQLRERQGAHSHFIDLCRLLGIETPPGATHWSVRSMAKAMGISHASVQRILREAG